jgi:hypothetical protein
MASQLGEQGVRIGLLLYMDRAGNRVSMEHAISPLVLWLDLEDFARTLVRRSFASIVLEQRSRAVHGTRP